MVAFGLGHKQPYINCEAATGRTTKADVCTACVGGAPCLAEAYSHSSHPREVAQLLDRCPGHYTDTENLQRLVCLNLAFEHPAAAAATATQEESVTRGIKQAAVAASPPASWAAFVSAAAEEASGGCLRGTGQPKGPKQLAL